MQKKTRILAAAMLALPLGWTLTSAGDGLEPTKVSQAEAAGPIFNGARGR